MTDAELQNWFQYHAPTGDQQRRYETIREAAKLFARIVRDNTPESADQTAAIRKIREAVMTANASIACFSPDMAVNGMMVDEHRRSR